MSLRKTCREAGESPERSAVKEPGRGEFQEEQVSTAAER